MILSNGRLLRSDSPEVTERSAVRWYRNRVAGERAYDEQGHMCLDYKIRVHQRRAMGNLTVEHWVAICEFFGGCAYCGKPLEVASCILEHVVPVCRGGATEVKNVVSSCWKCNKRKSYRDAEEFLGRRYYDFLKRHAECIRKVEGQ